eukprot:gnl/Chilomastix_cuspidata/2029.p1 GENE.gnl/Chilomastix_cuspidata/2029~~gnl/Chilomastix_cuspidata/2029.p1  ORF type:complete len:850 (-),score=405.68 gnl/Chilomastix_cuspidata/2029:76-2625(-)
MSGLSTTSDIWSVGATVLELLTGAPPYAGLPTMSVFYRIVKDAHPPLPGHLSDDCRRFLLRCFVKDPNDRPSAVELLRAPWIVKARQQRAMSGVRTILHVEEAAEAVSSSIEPSASSSTLGGGANGLQEPTDDDHLGTDSVSPSTQPITPRAPRAPRAHARTSFATTAAAAALPEDPPGSASLRLSRRVWARSARSDALRLLTDDEEHDLAFVNSPKSGIDLAQALRTTISQFSAQTQDDFDISSESDSHDGAPSEFGEDEVRGLIGLLAEGADPASVLERLRDIFRQFPPSAAFFRSHLGLFHLLQRLGAATSADTTRELIKTLRVFCVHQPGAARTVCALGFLPHLVRAVHSDAPGLTREATLFFAALVSLSRAGYGSELCRQSMPRARHLGPLQPELLDMLLACGSIDFVLAFFATRPRRRAERAGAHFSSCKSFSHSTVPLSADALALWTGVEILRAVAERGGRSEFFQLLAERGAFPQLAAHARGLMRARDRKGRKWTREREREARASNAAAAVGDARLSDSLSNFYRAFESLMVLVHIFSAGWTGTKLLCARPEPLGELVALIPSLLRDLPASAQALLLVAQTLANFAEVQAEERPLCTAEAIRNLVEMLRADGRHVSFAVAALHSLCRFTQRARRIAAAEDAPNLLALYALGSEGPVAALAADALVAIARDREARQVALRGRALEFFFHSVRTGGAQRVVCLDILDKGLAQGFLSGRQLTRGARGAALAAAIHRPPAHFLGQIAKILCCMCVRSKRCARFLARDAAFVRDLVSHLRRGAPAYLVDLLLLLRQVYARAANPKRFLAQYEVMVALRCLAAQPKLVIASGIAAELLAELHLQSAV